MLMPLKLGARVHHFQAERPTHEQNTGERTVQSRSPYGECRHLCAIDSEFETCSTEQLRIYHEACLKFLEHSSAGAAKHYDHAMTYHDDAWVAAPRRMISDRNHSISRLEATPKCVINIPTEELAVNVVVCGNVQGTGR
jgi:hypothetical protein